MEGADSMIVYLPDEEKDALETQKQVDNWGKTCRLLAIDITSKESCQKVIDIALSQMERINILVNNAAFQMVQKEIGDLSYEQWHKTFNTNIHPLFYLSKMVLPHMKSGDTIINNASINAYIGRPDFLDYTATKGAIVAFTRALSNQFRSKGIRVNAVCPGPIWTPLIPLTMEEEAQDSFPSAMGRPGQPSEVATCFVFLASQDSSFISDQSLHPKGGTVVNE
jgi:NAD(P)-dependent dehydrogenase (short-subunit alcohol dehydrogenase family)